MVAIGINGHARHYAFRRCKCAGWQLPYIVCSFAYGDASLLSELGRFANGEIAYVYVEGYEQRAWYYQWPWGGKDASSVAFPVLFQAFFRTFCFCCGDRRGFVLLCLFG